MSYIKDAATRIATEIDQDVLRKIMAERICKNCKWFTQSFDNCENPNLKRISPVSLDFGCNQWEAKE